jgi:hypothetical protein
MGLRQLSHFMMTHFIVEVIISLHHFAIRVAKPPHQGLLVDASVRAHRAKVMAE